MSPITVVLVRPREEGNVGAVARAMANMGLEDLVLVEPAPPLGGVARGFGVGGWHVLDGARRYASLGEALAPFRRVVGTTALRERPLESARPLTARELPAVLAADPPATPTALVFGPEDNGLRRAELELCHPVVHVPCAPERPTLNLAQAVLVVAYELHTAITPATTAPATTPPATTPPATTPPATTAEVEGWLAAVGRMLSAAGFDQSHIHRRLLADARRLTVRSGASSHEVRVLWRVVNRLLQRLGAGG